MEPSEKKPDIIAVYLPQYHETEDNDRWWGRGYTDWEAVKRAKPLFKGHAVPNVPLNENYYDLSRKESIAAQAQLARQYGIDGFCFYHYWFKDGKKELEKPAEILLKEKDIDIRFCFNWANESWIRSWSNISGNVWGENFEQTNADTNAGILVEQDYGREADWDAHFYYLLPFFLDGRYIRVEGKPVFIFYRPMDIPCLKKMTDRWNELAKKEGLAGLYFITAKMNASWVGLDASLIYQPRNAVDCMNEDPRVTVREGVRCFEYGDIWKAVLQSTPYQDSTTYFMGVAGYDDTPRRGRQGECFINNTPEIFSRNMQRLIEKSMACHNPFVFVNAWNEWGEGMYLEPDERNQYAYLQGLKRAKDEASVTHCIPGVSSTAADLEQESREFFYNENKYRKFLALFDQWLTLERKGRFSIKEYLEEQDIHSVAIYGLGLLGKQFYQELKYSGFPVPYAIDRYVGRYRDDLPIIRPENDHWPAADAVVVTAYEEDSVADFVSGKFSGKVIKLSRCINDLQKFQSEG